MRELWIATGNPGKLRELKRLIEPLGLRLRGLCEANDVGAVEEDQPTFAGNAHKKARALAAAVGAPALADDSGLCVDALHGAPGVQSARFAGPGASDADRIEKLLSELRSTTDRRAHFTCCLSLVDHSGAVLLEIEEQCPGVILSEPRGEGGFGYDPIFVAAQHLRDSPPRTFAELTSADKDAVSHRGKALRRLVAQLTDNPDLLPIQHP